MRFLGLRDRFPVGKHARRRVWFVVIYDPEHIISLIDYGYKGFADEVLEGMLLVGAL